MADYIRRLPVYLLLDCSASMAGEPVEAVRQGIKALLSELRGDPQAWETAWLSVITFDSHARQAVALTELAHFHPPALTAGGATSLGRALLLMMECAGRELRRAAPGQKGDWRPLAFILTDGVPTDPAAFALALEKLKSAGFADIVACAAGARAKTETLRRLTPDVLLLNSLSAGDLAHYFQWVTRAVRAAARGGENR